MSDNVNPGDIIRIDYPDGSAVEGEYVKPFAYLHVVLVGGVDYYMRPGAVTVLRRATRAPAPAPFKVGTWVRGKDSPDWIGVVTEFIDDSVMKARNWKSSFSTCVSADDLTILDGPPEPPDGSVYLISTTVYERYGMGHYQTGRHGLSHLDRLIGCFDDADLAALRILGNTGRAAS